jgi:dipeptidyl-peptidase 4
MRERYSRALAQTAPRISTQRSGLVVEGYWIDAFRYFFVGETVDPVLGIVNTPSLVDRQTGEITALLDLETIVGLIGSHLGRQVQPVALADAHFDWAGEGKVGVSAFGNNYVIDCREQRLASIEQAMDSPSLYSPDGRYACFVRGHDLWLCNRATRAEHRLTTDGAPNRCYGQASEGSLARSATGHIGVPAGRWSPDSQWFLTHLIDERHLPDLPTVEHVPPDGGRPRVHTYKYCMPGDPKPTLHIVAIHVASGRLVRFELGPTDLLFYSPFYYLMRSVWFESSRIAWFIRFDRFSRRAELIRLDLQEATAAVVFADEEARGGRLVLNTYFAERPTVWTLSRSDEFIWYSERDGWGHLYLHEASTGKVKSQITHGEYVVRSIIHVDEKARKVVFSAHGVNPAADPAQRTLCSSHFDGSGFEVLLSHEGDLYVPSNSIDGAQQDNPFHDSTASGGLSPDREFAVVQFWSVDRGNSTEVVQLSPRTPQKGLVVAAARPGAGENVPRPFAAVAADGTTRLHGVMFVPPGFDERVSYPLIVFIYPGPAYSHAPQSYLNVRSSHPRALAELGFVSIMLDTRRSAFRDRAFHAVGHGFLEPQLADHAAVVKQLCERHRFIDPNRIGILGSSAGGSATARAMFDYSELFKVGVSVCGAHDDKRGGAFMADTYLGPADADSADSPSNIDVAYKLQGKLLLMHGELDARVHVFHTLTLAAALIRANRDFELLVLPNEDHAALSTSGYAQRRMWDYFVQHLLGEQPPRDFEVRFEARGIERSIRRGLIEIM